ncbi:ribosomal L7Ae/L30e/S12e/Gadd45 family protein [Tumebacillus sp. DT12]|uniref:Ribosomal L7Ae/L30e/S12e/Gadd45 family protein n=1 Tax=Tumebacillus lacus TaxID=2995335 RepID=A0ABT3WVD6_9BACL|nr:ribosomal L7Ae/L30e/S12e/Gadd45 family protein [Tumebacillus lacus]MCX7568561.1 ribosomal L7Ae/L30e/S12e/Gadd45 family protein [Tumebacillus lacus]
MSEQQFANMLGLAKRAGALVTGHDACLAQVRAGKAALALVARDTGANAMKKYHDKCKHYKVPLIEVLDKISLGQAVGKPHSAIVVVTESGFAKRIRQLAGENAGGDAQ